MIDASIEAVLRGEARWAVVVGDSRDVLATMPDRSVANVITDPPYDEHTHSHVRSLGGGKAHDIPIDFDALTDMSFVPEMLRVTQRWVLAFCALEQLGDYKRAAGDDAWTRAAIWHRTDGLPQLSCDRPAQGAEGIACMHRPDEKKRWNGMGERGHWSYGVERTDREHPTQKPIRLLLRLVELFTEPDEIILDTYAGSGTTGVAALRLGRRCILIEKTQKWAALARERMLAEEADCSLATIRDGQEMLGRRFCDFCAGGRQHAPMFLHAPMNDGRWICEACWHDPAMRADALLPTLTGQWRRY